MNRLQKPVGSVMPTLAIAVAAMLLGACGGGDAGDPPPASGNPPPSNPPPSNPPPSNPPPGSTPTTLVLGSSTLEVEAVTTDRAVSRTVTFSLQNLQVSQQVFVGGTYGANAIQNASFAVNGASGQVAVVFRKPFETAPGTYTDTITIQACTDSPCVNHIAGSPKTISVTYRVANPSNMPRMTLDRTSISVDGFMLDPGVPQAQTVEAVYTNLDMYNGTAITPYVSATGTNSAVTSVSHINTPSVSGLRSRISIILKPGTALAPGTYTDVVTARACLDAACVNELAGSPATISVQYSISESTTGPNGFTARTVAAVANDVVWDAARQVLYVAMAQTSPANANTIGVLDPLTGIFSSYAPVGINPGRLALSADGQYLYVALRGTNAIQRLLLPSLTPDLTIPLGTRASDGSPLYVKEMHVSPDAPRTVAVVRTASATSLGSEYDLAVFDDAVMRPQRLGGGTQHLATTFQWDTGARIFAVDSLSSAGTAYQLAVGPDGLAITASQQSVTSFDWDAFLANGRMYMQRGRVFDPLTFAQLGTFPLGVAPGTTVLATDTDAGKAFFLMSAYLRSYDLQTLEPIGSIWLPRADPRLLSTRIVRWGRDGMALLNHLSDSPGILLIHGPFVQP